MLRTEHEKYIFLYLDGSGGVPHSFAHRPGLYCTAAQAFPAMEKMGGLQWQIARPEVGLAPESELSTSKPSPIATVALCSRVHIGRVQYKFQNEILGAARYLHSFGIAVMTRYSSFVPRFRRCDRAGRRPSTSYLVHFPSRPFPHMKRCHCHIKAFECRLNGHFRD